MKILAEIVVNHVAFLMLDREIPPAIALCQLDKIGRLLLDATDEEKQAVLEVCRTTADALPGQTDAEVRDFFRNFGAEMGLENPFP